MKKIFGAMGLAAVMITVSVSTASSVKAAAAKGDAAKGKEVFEQCSVCHNADSDEKKMGPGLKGLAKRKLKNGKEVNDATLKAFIRAGGNGMPPYSEDQVSDNEMADLIAYLKTL